MIQVRNLVHKSCHIYICCKLLHNILYNEYIKSCVVDFNIIDIICENKFVLICAVIKIINLNESVKNLNLSFYGAAKEVTGSCYYLEANRKKFIVDCGLQQGQDEKDDQKLPFNAIDIDFVVLTHAHIDHSGRLPLLVKEGFIGKIYATKATCDLLSLMLKDSAHIKEMDAMWENKKRKRSGKDEVTPLYSIADAENTLKYLVPCSYGNIIEISDGIKVNFVDAGHILGSASAEIFLSEDSITKKIVFSGDIGNTNQPIIKDPQYIREADYVVMEATYGDRNHEKSEDYTIGLAKVINETLSRGGNVVIPSFAVARTQELLYFIREIKEKKLVVSIPDFPVYVDSPLASGITKLYDEDLSGYADEQAKIILNKGVEPLSFSNLIFTDSTEESKALNYDPVPKVIISSSGMCEAGRIRHHLKYNLWRKESSIVFVGFQANGTLGRILLDGVKKVKLLGEDITVLASIYNFTGLSAHADRAGLLKWITSFDKKPDKVFVTHGEDSVCDEFVKALTEMGFLAVAPLYKSVYSLSSGELVTPGIEAEKKVEQIEKSGGFPSEYEDLLRASERLLDIVGRKEGSSKKDLAKFSQEITALAKNWDK
jgi:metallo-beta-lactamase family protein